MSTRRSGALIAIPALLAAACASETAQRPTEVASAACVQLGDVSRVVSPLITPGTVHSVREVREAVLIGRASVPTRTAGADLYVHATPQSLPPEYLGRALACHAAHGRPLSDRDPFHPRSGPVTVSVRSAGHSYAIRVVAADRNASEEVLWRARSLVSSPVITVEQIASGPSISAL